MDISTMQLNSRFGLGMYAQMMSTFQNQKLNIAGWVGELSSLFGKDEFGNDIYEVTFEYFSDEVKTEYISTSAMDPIDFDEMVKIVNTLTLLAAKSS